MTGHGAVRHPVSALPVVAKIDVAGFPDWVGIDDAHSAVWISNRDRNNVARIDPSTNRLAHEVMAGRGPCSGLAICHGSDWAPCCPDRKVVRESPATNLAVASIAMAIADSEGGIAADDPGRQVRPLPGRRPRRGLGPQPGRRHRLADRPCDPPCCRHHRARRSGPWGDIAVGEGAVWVTDLGTPLSTIDPATNQVTAQFVARTPGGKDVGDALRVGSGAAWLGSFGLQQLWRIDLNRM